MKSIAMAAAPCRLGAWLVTLLASAVEAADMRAEKAVVAWEEVEVGVCQSSSPEPTRRRRRRRVKLASAQGWGCGKKVSSVAGLRGAGVAEKE